MKKIIFFLFIILTAIANAQTSRRDSLNQLLLKEGSDTGRSLLMGQLSGTYLYSRPDTAMDLSLQALTLSQKAHFDKGIAFSLNKMGAVYEVLGDYPKALDLFFQALKIDEKINNIDGLQRNYNNIGEVFNQQEDYRMALNYYRKAKELAEKTNNNYSLSIVLVNMGESYLGIRDFYRASRNTEDGYNLAYQYNYPKPICSALRVMGEINSLNGLALQALDSYRRCLPYSLKTENYLRISDAYLGMAKLFQKSASKDSALYYAKQSLRFAKEKKFTLQIRDAGRFLSYYYRELKIPDSAFAYQDVSKAANDSLFSQQRQRQFQTLAFDEKVRQQQVTMTELNEKQERRRNLEFALLGIGLLSLIIIFLLLTQSVIVTATVIKVLGLLILLLVFEFINLFIHPFISRVTNDSPVWMFLVLVCIGALLARLHHKLEIWISSRLVEKNNKIRLEAARKTIEELQAGTVLY